VRGGTTLLGGKPAVVLAVALGALLTASVAAADDPRTLRTEAERLRAENQSLEARSHEALLQLYALESRLARAEARLVALEGRAAEVKSRTDVARGDLRLARADLAEGERRLGSHLQTLYVEGDVDPLAVLLGAESLDEALEALDGLDRLAADDRTIIAEVRRARERLENAIAELEARSAELEDLIAEAAATRSALVDARAERSAYIASLRDEQAFNASRIDSLLAQAAAAEAEAALIAAQPAETEVLVAATSEPTATSEPAESPVVFAAPASGSGSTLTVESTGYCLTGTTATGTPVGWGTIAVDPGVIPLGTSMTVPGYGTGVAADTGSAIQGNRIDLWFPSCDQALLWGRRTVTITLH
jgi:peptidoglycan DL-endopeptidase CwlO